MDVSKSVFAGSRKCPTKMFVGESVDKAFGRLTTQRFASDGFLFVLMRKERLKTAMQTQNKSHKLQAQQKAEVSEANAFQEGYCHAVSCENSEMPQKNPKAYAYTTKTNRIRLRIIDGMDSICANKGEPTKDRAKYYDSYDFKKTDPDGSYTGIPTEPFGSEPVQDADDL